MRNPNRIPVIIKEIEEFWKENPDLRLGQLIVILATRHRPDVDVFNVGDTQLMKNLQNFKKDDKERKENQAES